jgi:hypothetical protein
MRGFVRPATTSSSDYTDDPEYTEIPLREQNLQIKTDESFTFPLTDFPVAGTFGGDRHNYAIVKAKMIYQDANEVLWELIFRYQQSPVSYHAPNEGFVGGQVSIKRVKNGG